MVKFVFLLVLLPGITLAQPKRILNQSYNFLVVDGEVKKLTQSHDTLYQFHCYIDKPCIPKAEKHYKILSSAKTAEIVILKLEQLDTIQLTTDHYPKTRYCVIALKNINAQQLGYLPLQFNLTRGQIDTLKTNTVLLKEKFFFTYFSDKQLLEFEKLKKITTKQEALQITKATNSDQIKQLVSTYKKTKTWDMYAAGLSAEMLNQICLEQDTTLLVRAGQLML